MREMKDSGIEWIGNVPATWERCKIKNVISSIGSGTTPTSSNIDYYNSEDICWIQSGDLYKTSYISNTAVSLSAKALHLSALQIYAAPFIVVAMYGASVGNIAISTIDACSNQACCCIKPDNNNDLKFMYYWLSMCKIDFLSQSIGGGQPNISQSKIKNQFYYRPQLSEQKVIANFLDSKCSEIDALSADIQKEIEILEQYKRSVITEAVTKGLNPDAETKKSTIFYMAPYNFEWRLSKIGYECTKLARPFSPADTPLLCTNKGKVSPRPSDMTGKMVSEDNAMQGIHKGDIAIHGMDTWHGAIAMSEYDGKITRVVHVCDSKQDKRFIVYYLQQLAFNDVYKLISFGIRGNTSDFRSWDKVKDIYIALPDIDEQQKISDFLDLECRRVEDIVSEKKKQLDVLDAYKKSLIYEYVTGKKEVPAQN